MKIISGILAALALMFVVQADAAMAQEKRHARVGMLSCNLDSSIGFVVGSHQNMTCSFTRDDNGQVFNYSGVGRRVGLDIGFTQGGQMIWGVFASTQGIDAGALAGTYVGASADAAVLIGGGANILIGGTDRSVMLQPLSLSGQTGLNLAVGLGSLELTPVQ